MTRVSLRGRGHRFARALRGFARAQQGAAAVEFAVFVPVVLFTLFLVVDFGRLLWTQNVLSAAAREGARLAAAAAIAPTSGSTTATSAQTRATSYVTSVLGTSGLPSGATVTVSYDAGTGLVTVLISGYRYTPITPFGTQIGLGNFVMTQRAVFRWELSS
jgi:Flp pilus assembly protein TadG